MHYFLQNVACFLVFYILVTFQHFSLNFSFWFDISSMFNKVGVDVREYNEFDVVDVDWKSAKISANDKNHYYFI